MRAGSSVMGRQVRALTAGAKGHAGEPESGSPLLLKLSQDFIDAVQEIGGGGRHVDAGREGGGSRRAIGEVADRVGDGKAVMAERQLAHLSVAVGGATSRFADQLGCCRLPEFNRIQQSRGEGLPTDSDVEPT